MPFSLVYHSSKSELNIPYNLHSQCKCITLLYNLHVRVYLSMRFLCTIESTAITGPVARNKPTHRPYGQYTINQPYYKVKFILTILTTIDTSELVSCLSSSDWMECDQATDTLHTRLLMRNYVLIFLHDDFTITKTE